MWSRARGLCLSHSFDASPPSPAPGQDSPVQAPPDREVTRRTVARSVKPSAASSIAVLRSTPARAPLELPNHRAAPRPKRPGLPWVNAFNADPAAGTFKPTPPGAPSETPPCSSTPLSFPSETCRLDLLARIERSFRRTWNRDLASGEESPGLALPSLLPFPVAAHASGLCTRGRLGRKAKPSGRATRGLDSPAFFPSGPGPPS